MIEEQDDNGTPIRDTRDEFTQALGLFTNMFTRDKNLQQLMMEAILKGTGGFNFKDDEEGANIGKHSNRYDKLICDINKLQGPLNQLSEDDKKNIFFKSFKNEWQDLCHKD